MHVKILFNNFILFSFIPCYLFCNVNGERTKDKMYETIEGTAACFRRLNATHQIGCSSLRRGSTGVVHIIRNLSDIDWLLKEADAGPYMPVIEMEMFTRDNLNLFKAYYPDHISGVILINGTIPTHFSHDSKCPNSNFELSGTCEAKEDNRWNNYGTDLLHEDFPYPIFFVSNSTYADSIINCSEKFNNHNRTKQKSRSLCSLELKSFMYAAVNTEICIRRSRLQTNLNLQSCDPMGDRNVWSTLFPRGKFSIKENNKTIEQTVDQNGKIILIAARLDTASMFDGLAPGAISPVSGLVTLLTSALMLKSMLNTTGPNGENVLFVIFNGESFDYIGSQRLVYDMQNYYFPLNEYDVKYKVPKIKLEDIHLFIELSQLSDTKNLFVHHVVYENNETNKMLNSIIRNLKSEAGDQYQVIEDLEGKIPPSSLQTFLKANKNIPGIVLTDHSKNYRNHYYNSMFDDAINLNYTYYNSSEIPSDSIQGFLSEVAFTISKIIYENIMSSKYTGDNLSNIEIVNDLIYCYLYSANCKLFKLVTFEQKFDDKPASLYVGVDKWLNVLPTITGRILAHFTGDTTTLSKEKCQSDKDVPVFQYLWMKYNDNSTGVCVRTTMNFTDAISPAFVIRDYDWKSGMYSTWSESLWRDISMRMFLKPSAAHETMTISIGTTVLILSFILVYFINTKADILFNTGENIVGTSC